tara:strand:- start:67 stop:378 length:312 start_codon:yes stop_codon:yes gene_type:complete
MILLKPDMYTNMIHYYHRSNKLLIPLGCASYINNKYLEKPKLFPDMLTALTFGFHSFFSISSIITDYIKPKYIQNIIRISNSSIHLISISGFVYYIYENNTKI